MDRRTEDYRYLIPEDASRVLDQWARWMRRGTVGRGYPSSSAFCCRNLSSFEDLEEEVDSRVARVVDRVIRDMGKAAVPLEREALQEGIPQPELLASASEEFMRRARKEGIL